MSFSPELAVDFASGSGSELSTVAGSEGSGEGRIQTRFSAEAFDFCRCALRFAIFGCFPTFFLLPTILFLPS